MSTRRFDFNSPAGYPLSGQLEAPECTPRGWAVFAHCFTCGKNSLAAARVSRALAKIGIGVLRFDFAGLGTSGGRFGDAGFAADTLDLIAAGEALRTAGFTPTLLIGHSLGGAAVLAAAADMPTVRAVATIGAPADIRHVLGNVDPAKLEEIHARGEAEVLLGGRPFVVTRRFVDGLAQIDLETRIAALHRSLLILHSPIDEVVGIDHARRIFGAAHHPKSFISLDDADHLLTRPADADYVADLISSWVSRYLPAAAEPPEPVRDSKEVIAEETGRGPYQVEIRTAGTRLLADEPVSAGGLGTGPSPYDLLSASLAACTTMTLRWYADRHEWPLARVRTAVTHVKSKDDHPADRFTCAITIEGSLDESQRQTLMSIAERCPVHRTLTAGSSVETRSDLT
jgi:uncharacterized OsmC-like protein/alpha-beta hydrolase superfamily lysophospholipase